MWVRFVFRLIRLLEEKMMKDTKRFVRFRVPNLFKPNIVIGSADLLVGLGISL